MNLSPIYIKVINKVMNYLRSTKILKFKFERGDKLEIALNISFTNNIINRKSL